MSRRLKSGKDDFRNNKNFQILKRDLDLKAKEKKNRKVPDVGTSPLDFYIDKDKAAAIGYTHDLKIDIKTGLFRKDKKFASAEDELTVETFLLQGEHELKWRRPESAFYYFNIACQSPGLERPEPFLARSRSLIQLGHYTSADEDATLALQLQPSSLEALHAKGNSLYNLGSFEHALVYFHRANRQRPRKNAAKVGILQCTDAILNSLGKQNTQVFSQMESILDAMIFCRQKEALLKAMDFGGLGRKVVTSPEIFQGSSVQMKFKRLKSKALAMKDEQKSKQKMTLLDSLDLISAAKLEDNSRNASRGNTDQHLLGKLHEDKVFLENLLKNPVLHFSSRANDRIAQRMIQKTARDGLKYLESRKKFWQQQNPLYSRQNQMDVQSKSSRKSIL